MAYSNRPYGDDGNGVVRKFFRPMTNDYRRLPKNGRSTKPAPPEMTNAESFYYLKQMNTKTPMVIVMTDGEEIRGCIEWYDRHTLKVRGRSKMLIFKSAIKYMFKQGEIGA